MGSLFPPFATIKQQKANPPTPLELDCSEGLPGDKEKPHEIANVHFPTGLVGFSPLVADGLGQLRKEITLRC